MCLARAIEILRSLPVMGDILALSSIPSSRSDRNTVLGVTGTRPWFLPRLETQQKFGALGLP